MSTAVVTYGRFSPPTIGHLKLIKQLSKVAADVDGTPLVYMSTSYDGVDAKKPARPPQAARNPLKFEDKLRFLRDSTDTEVVDTKCVNMFGVLHDVYKAGYNECFIIVGDDRVADFGNDFTKYNGYGDVAAPMFYEFNSPPVVISAGARDDDSDDALEAMSASKLRACVVDDDFETFEQGAATRTLTREMWDTLKDEMGLT
jgi:hypothetical protein